MLRSLPPTILLLAACSDGTQRDEAPPEASPDALPDAAPASGGDEVGFTPRPRRSDDPRVVELRRALDDGDVELARAHVDRAAELAGPVEGPLLRARLAAHLPDGHLESARWLAEARRAGVDDPRVPATAAELYAWSGQLAEAQTELSAAAVDLGSKEPSPELLRAHAVRILCTPGGRAREGLAFLERALELDPDLPFVGRPLGQAHLLVAKELARAGETAEALASVRRSLEHDPDDLDARRMEAELLTGVGEWGNALAVYEELLDEGLDLHGEAADLYQRAAFWAEINHDDRALAERYLLRALDLGLPRSALNDTLSDVLRDLADEAAERGAASLEEGELEAAERALDRAIELDPEHLMALNFRATLLARRGGEGAFERAARDWHLVIDLARADGIELPEPVHLKLANHQLLALGDLAAARETLEAYLVLEPAGRWRDATERLLATLPAVDGEEGDGGSEPGGGP